MYNCFKQLGGFSVENFFLSSLFFKKKKKILLEPPFYTMSESLSHSDAVAACFIPGHRT